MILIKNDIKYEWNILFQIFCLLHGGISYLIFFLENSISRASFYKFNNK